MFCRLFVYCFTGLRRVDQRNAAYTVGEAAINCNSGCANAERRAGSTIVDPGCNRHAWLRLDAGRYFSDDGDAAERFNAYSHPANWRERNDDSGADSLRYADAKRYPGAYPNL